AVVLEVRLRALREREELGRIVGDGGLLLGRLGLGRGRGLGVAEARLARARRAGVWRRGGGELLVVAGLGLGHHFCSSTTSASTTSSSSAEAPLAEPVAAEPSAASAEPAALACCSAWARSYMASETLWNAVCSVSVLARMSSASSPLTASLTAAIADSISLLEAESICSPRSLTCFSAW